MNILNKNYLETDLDIQFDVIVMNPPYNQMLDMAFNKKSHSISDITLCVHPSTWLLDEKDIQKKFTSTKEIVKDDLISIELFNGNGIFGVSLFVPCVITYINKNIIHNGIECVDRINGVILVYDNIDQINKFSNIDYYPRLKEKIKNVVKENGNLFDKLRETQNGNFWVSLSKIIGHVKDRTYFVNLAQIRGNVNSEMVKNDFYTMVTKDLEISLEPKQQPVSFTTEIEAKNFLGYVKTNFVRFCLAIYKNNGNLHRGEIKLIPWLDFTQEWTDEKLYECFNITPEEIAFIEKVIPKYY